MNGVIFLIGFITLIFVPIKLRFPPLEICAATLTKTSKTGKLP